MSGAMVSAQINADHLQPMAYNLRQFCALMDSHRPNGTKWRRWHKPRIQHSAFSIQHSAFSQHSRPLFLNSRKKSMAFLSGKRILITGVISNRSIAYGIAQACQRQGAEIALTYVGERFEKRIQGLAEELGASFVLPLDVSSDAEIEELNGLIQQHWDSLDGLVHSIGFAPREAIAGDFLEGLSREAFAVAHDISAYSFPALVKATLPLLEGRDSSVLTLTYLGAEKAIPNYNTMGLAKASLEASVRYLAASLGPRGIRANAISAGPVRTLAASGIQDFNKILNFVEQNAPLRRNVTIQDVGNAAAFLLSDLAAGITGEITHVDAGFSSVTPGMVG